MEIVGFALTAGTVSVAQPKTPPGMTFENACCFCAAPSYTTEAMSEGPNLGEDESTLGSKAGPIIRQGEKTALGGRCWARGQGVSIPSTAYTA